MNPRPAFNQFSPPDGPLRTLPDPTIVEARCGRRRGDKVKCRIRHCTSDSKMDCAFPERSIEEVDGVLDRSSLSGDLWFVKTDRGCRLVWDDEITTPTPCSR